MTRVLRFRDEAKPVPTEHEEQALVVAWFALYAPTRGLDPRQLIAIPNAGKRSYAVAAMLKAEGMRKDAPDLILLCPKLDPERKRKLFEADRRSPLFHGLTIELKRIGGKARPGQIEYADLLRRAGYSAVICQGADEAIQAIRGYCEA